MTDRKRETVERVEFRWRQHEFDSAQRLEEAAQEAGRSSSDHARELVKNALSASERLEHNLHVLQQEVAQLRQQLRELSTIKEGLRVIDANVYEFRNDLATCTIKILTDAGLLPLEAAQQWVKETLDAE
jgi:small-conductance mechanosensitive channel